MILSQKIPQTNGFDNVGAVNVGATRNKGLEIGLNTVNIQTKDFSWTTNLSLNYSLLPVKQFYDEYL